MPISYLMLKFIHLIITNYLYILLSQKPGAICRGLLAYYYSILHLMKEHSTAAFCPIIIDSPNQQDQDFVNLKKMLGFIRDKRPEILATGPRVG